MDKTYKMKIKKGIFCAILVSILGLLAFLSITMLMYLNGASKLNMGTRETVYKCAPPLPDVEEIAGFFDEYVLRRVEFGKNRLYDSDPASFQQQDQKVFCFCEQFGFFDVLNDRGEISRFCRFFKISQTIKNTMSYVLPLMILLSNNFYRQLILKLIQVFPFKEKSHEVFLQTFLYLLVGFNEIVGLRVTGSSSTSSCFRRASTRSSCSSSRCTRSSTTSSSTTRRTTSGSSSSARSSSWSFFSTSSGRRWGAF